MKLKKNDRLQAGYTGQLYAGRGVGTLVELARRSPFADIHVVGGNERDIRELREFAAGISNFFVHGFMKPSDISGFRAGCDVLLAPYQKTVTIDGRGDTASWMSPLKIFEYMASGRPIVVSDLPVLREVLEPEVNCLMCPPENTDAWVKALERLHTEPETRARLAEAALKQFLMHYTWRRRAEKILEVYQ